MTARKTGKQATGPSAAPQQMNCRRFCFVIFPAFLIIFICVAFVVFAAISLFTPLFELECRDGTYGDTENEQTLITYTFYVSL